jgi:hypothetical protein
MNWPLVIALTLVIAYVVRGIATPVAEGFQAVATQPAQTTEEAGYVRDQRYREAFADIAGHGAPVDFCRAVAREGDPDSLMIACALGGQEVGSSTEYRSRTKRHGLRMSRDDYWRPNRERPGRMDYCRILRDEVTGEFYSSCLIAGRDGFKEKEERDTTPPPAIEELLHAYNGIMTWFRWRDDAEDYAGVAATHAYGRPVFPSEIGVVLSRGVEFNRWSPAAQAAGHRAPPLRDYLRWGERHTLALDQDIAPRHIRAIAFWVYWDALEHNAVIMEAENTAKKDRIWIGIEGGGYDLPPVGPLGGSVVVPALEASPAVVQAIGQLTQPAPKSLGAPSMEPLPLSKSGRYVFEIWDAEQRLMRLESPHSAVAVGAWQHVVITTHGSDAWWPTWQMWIDGKLVSERVDGRLSPAMELTENYIGKGFRGCLQDFRIYREPMGAEKIHEAIAWSKDKLHPVP